MRAGGGRGPGGERGELSEARAAGLLRSDLRFVAAKKAGVVILMMEIIIMMRIFLLLTVVVGITFDLIIDRREEIFEIVISVAIFDVFIGNDDVLLLISSSRIHSIFRK